MPQRQPPPKKLGESIKLSFKEKRKSGKSGKVRYGSKKGEAQCRKSFAVGTYCGCGWLPSIQELDLMLKQ